MKFTLKPYNRNDPDEELLNDLIAVSKKTGRKTVTMDEYVQHGKYHPDTLKRRFDCSWFEILEKVGLEKSRSDINIPEKELFKNIEDIWVQLGRQPKYEEVIKPFSKYSVGTYEYRFTTWLKALEKFVEYINEEENAPYEEKPENIQAENARKEVTKHKTKRNISSRLKVQVLMRDGNKCQLCGITVIGKGIHIDHIKPWSKGGETVLENLQVLCAPHNLAKGNLEYNEK